MGLSGYTDEGSSVPQMNCFEMLIKHKQKGIYIHISFINKTHEIIKCNVHKKNDMCINYVTN